MINGPAVQFGKSFAKTDAPYLSAAFQMLELCTIKQEQRKRRAKCQARVRTCCSPNLLQRVLRVQDSLLPAQTFRGRGSGTWPKAI